MRTMILCGAIALLTACSFRQRLGDPADGGTGATGDGGGGPPDALPIQVCSPLPDGGPPELPIIAVWDGYTEQPNVYADPIDDRVRITVRGTDPSAPTATIQFGDPAAVPAPPPQNSTLCYPEPEDWSPMGGNLYWRTLQGFEYPLVNLTYSDVRLKAGYTRAFAFDVWCRCQPPIEAIPGSGSYACLPNSGGGSGPEGCFVWSATSPGSEIIIPCCKKELCADYLPHACVCTSAGCTYNPEPNESFDLSINGDHADGSGIHLVRVQ